MTGGTGSPPPTGEERISGFLDKELSSAEREQVEASIASDGALGEQVERLRRNDDLVRRAGASLAGDETPERFARLIDEALLRPNTQHGSTPPAPPSANDNWTGRLRFGGALAASLVLGLLLGTQLAGSNHEALISDPLAAGLEKVASGKGLRLASGQRFSPRLTFARQGGGYCREFSLVEGNANATGLACRGKSGWNVEALVPGTAAASADEGYAVAEGPSASGVDELINAYRNGDPLDAKAEAKLIQRDWRE
jgi:hypothetical protein